MKVTTKQLLIISFIVSVLTLPATIVWLEIGPLGKIFYGNEVPDIYILGGLILGKDRNFWGINFAYKFQLLIIIYFAVTTLLTVKYLHMNILATKLTVVNLILIVLFPIWLYLYIDGVICNSDGAAADLKIHFGIGLIFVLSLLILNLITIRRIRNASR